MNQNRQELAKYKYSENPVTFFGVIMTTFRQIRESLGIHEGKQVPSKKEANPGDWWKTTGGNFVGMKKRKKGEKENPTQGYDNEKKAQTYAAGGDPDKVDDKKDDNGKSEPVPEKEPESKPKKKPATPRSPPP